MKGGGLVGLTYNSSKIKDLGIYVDSMNFLFCLG